MLHAWWRAANYLSVGQIYLLDNPLLRAPLTVDHVKPRLLGHWGTTPGLNFIYAHMNRVIRARDLSAPYIAGPGHGGPGMVANTSLEGTYSEVCPHIGPDEEGLRRLFRQFSFPGGIPSHVAPKTPGSIHEGGELGYALAHAYGAALDNPDLLVCCVIGDGEAETGPLATSWHSNKFLNPARDGAVLPILHLNGYKIANPTVLARMPHEELRALLKGYGYAPRFVEGEDREAMHRLMADTLDEVTDEAVRDGACVETTMGFTPLEGLVMATRSGSIDPGLLLWLLEPGRLEPAELADGLEHASGLLRLAGSADMRDLLARADDDARLAIEVYDHRLRAHVAAMAAALGGLDALVFTGGVGERSPEIRARAAGGLGFLGVALDLQRNEAVDGDADISANGAAVRTLVTRAREDLEIAAQVRRTLGAT